MLMSMINLLINANVDLLRTSFNDEKNPNPKLFEATMKIDHFGIMILKFFVSKFSFH